MTGRRVAPKAKKHNPLYVLFMLLLVLTIVLAAAVGVLSFKLHAAQKELARYQSAQMEQPTQQEKSEQSDVEKPPVDDMEMPEPAEAGGQTAEPAQQTAETEEKAVDWLDLSGHSEVEMTPSSVFKEYYTYYTTGTVNLRGGPSTSYSKVKLLDSGKEVKAAAKQDGWTFVSADGKFGWIKSDYLSLEKQEPAAPAPAGNTETTKPLESAGEVPEKPVETPENSAEVPAESAEPTQTADAAITQ